MEQLLQEIVELLASYSSAQILIVLMFLVTTGIMLFKFLGSVSGIKAQSNTVKDLMKKALDLAIISIAQGEMYDIRACVFLAKGKGVGIYFLSSNMMGSADSTITLDKWQGCTGMAWGYEKTVVADLTLPEAQGGASWNLTENQIKLTRNIKAILCVPVFDNRYNNDLIGLLSFDSSDDIVDFFNQEKTLLIATEVANMISALLVQFDVAKPLN